MGTASGAERGMACMSTIFILCDRNWVLGNKYSGKAIGCQGNFGNFGNSGTRKFGTIDHPCCPYNLEPANLAPRDKTSLLFRPLPVPMLQGCVLGDALYFCSLGKRSRVRFRGKRKTKSGGPTEPNMELEHREYWLQPA